MKHSAITLLLITTAILITVAIFAAMELPFRWVFFLTVLGEILLIYSVIRVLKDRYSTKKTFKDYYEDHPINKEEERL